MMEQFGSGSGHGPLFAERENGLAIGFSSGVKENAGAGFLTGMPDWANISAKTTNIVDKKSSSAVYCSLQERRCTRLKNLRMKAARVGCDLSQEDLAQRVGVTRQTIGMIEAGRFNPSLALCVAICRALGKTLDDLFWEEEDGA